ncbi:hypothetical protein RJ639_032759 [Escallonia herrerae]|uniref:Retrotransposon gag domain-containing protein n=1 Tax=Escallonia herrerae TaxID=1293975 RepID=A0AA88X7G3_9ASTE|nr:hypothetical protein RJ639_032759 [Escallonia herrerae]
MASNTSEHHFNLPVMMTSAISLEEQLAAMSRAIEKLTKTVEEKDLQIANLMNKLESKKSEESKSGDIDDVDEALKQADTNEHPDASTSGGYKNKERNAFDWYTDLEPESIDCWEEIKREFQSRFYSTRRSVSMMELTNTKQGKLEHVVDYINRWQALSLDCKERLFEAFAVEMYSKVPGILDFLLEHKLIDLPRMKCMEEAGQVNEPRYCEYHRLISHPTEKCFTLKKVIMDLSKNGKIHLDDEKVEESNNTSVIFGAVVSSASCQQQENGSPKGSMLGASKA